MLQVMMHIKRGDTPYTAYFCEENIWWLAGTLIDNGQSPDMLHVLFFSNAHQSIVMLKQNAATPDQPIAWDYHVVLLVNEPDEAWILDPDSRLPFPTPADRYMAESFPQQTLLKPAYRTMVRVVPAASYCERFYSDRSHMRGQLPETRFPDYPVIQPDWDARPLTLAQYRDFTTALDDGSHVLPLSAFDITRPGM